MIIYQRKILSSVPAFVIEKNKRRKIELNTATLPVHTHSDHVLYSALKEWRWNNKTKPIGLKNAANACYLNSVISSLMYLVQDTNQEDISHDECTNEKNCLSCRFMIFIRKQSPTTLSKSSFGKMVQIYARRSKLDFNGQEPGDAVKFFIHLLEWMIQAQIQNHRIRGSSSDLVDLDASLKQLTTLFGRIFMFITQQSTTCSKCRRKSLRRTVNRLLPVYGCGDTLQQLVNKRMDEETVSNYVCEYCNESCDHLFETELLSSPSCLVLQFIRTRTPATISVSGEEHSLDIVNPLSVSLSAQGQFITNYEAAAVVCHCPSNDSPEEQGHYVSFIKRRHWYIVDDDCVSQVASADVERAISEGAVLAFYKCTGPCLSFDQCDQLQCHQLPENDKGRLERVDLPIAEAIAARNQSQQLATGLGCDAPLTFEITAATPSNQQDVYRALVHREDPRDNSDDSRLADTHLADIQAILGGRS